MTIDYALFAGGFLLGAAGVGYGMWRFFLWWHR